MLSSAKRNCEMGINPQVLVDRTPYGTPWYLYIYQSTRTCQKTCLSVFPYIFQAKYVRNKKINENKLVGGTTTWGTTWGPVYEQLCINQGKIKMEFYNTILYISTFLFFGS